MVACLTALVAASAVAFTVAPSQAAPVPRVINSFGRALEIAPPPALSTNGRDDGLAAVSCWRAGDCAAGGGYLDTSLNSWPMVVTLSPGGPSPLTELAMPGDAAAAPQASVNGISCVTGGRCVAVGGYALQIGGGDAYIEERSGGGWLQAFHPALPVNAAFPPQASLSAVSCTGPGRCVAAGSYLDKAGNAQLMVIAEIGGLWHQGREVAAPRDAVRPVSLAESGLSCYKKGSCVGVGVYTSKSGTTPLVFTESAGRWRRATRIDLPRNAIHLVNSNIALASVSCTGTGRCAAVGSYLTKKLGTAMAVTGTNGLSARAVQVTAAPPVAGKHPFISNLGSVSCVSAARCVATGTIEAKAGGAFQAMSLIWSKGTWGHAHEVRLPADADSTKLQIASLSSVSCRPAGFCAAVGYFIYVPDVNLNVSAMAALLP